MSLPTGSLARFALAALLVLVGVDAAVRVSAGQLDQPLLHYSSETQVLANDLDELSNQTVTSDLAFLGSSMVGRAIYPEVFEQRLAGVTDAHNLGLPAASTVVVEEWGSSRVIPALQPSCIAWGVSSMDFNSGRQPQPTIDLYRAAPATRPGWRGSAGRLMNDVWATYRYRHVFLEPFDLGKGVGPDDRVAPLGDRGNFDKSEWISTRNEFETNRIENEVLANFAVGDAEVAALRDGVARFAESADLVVISMPVPPSYIDRHPRQAADFDEFRRVLAAEAASLEVEFIDAAEWMSEDDFHDYTHLSPEPAQAFSARLAEEFKARGFCS